MMSYEGEGGFSICSFCIKVCHADHEVKYVQNDVHFCDCGAKGEEVCLALKPIGKLNLQIINQLLKGPTSYYNTPFISWLSYRINADLSNCF
jgi:hypothetical protein